MPGGTPETFRSRLIYRRGYLTKIGGVRRSSFYTCCCFVSVSVDVCSKVKPLFQCSLLTPPTSVDPSQLFRLSRGRGGVLETTDENYKPLLCLVSRTSAPLGRPGEINLPDKTEVKVEGPRHKSEKEFRKRCEKRTRQTRVANTDPMKTEPLCLSLIYPWAQNDNPGVVQSPNLN